MTKLVYIDVQALEGGNVAQGAFLDERGALCLGQFMKNKEGKIQRVIRNGNLNPISTFYLQGAKNDEQMWPKDKSAKIMASCGGVDSRELSGGLDKDKKPLPARNVTVRFTFIKERGLSQYDPRAYDCQIISDGTVAKLEGEYTL